MCCLSYCPVSFWPLYCLSFFDLPILITHLVSTNYSYIVFLNYHIIASLKMCCFIHPTTYIKHSHFLTSCLANWPNENVKIWIYLYKYKICSPWSTSYIPLWDEICNWIFPHNTISMLCTVLMNNYYNEALWE